MHIIFCAVTVAKPAGKIAPAVETVKPTPPKKRPAGDIDYAALLEKAREKSATVYAQVSGKLQFLNGH